VSAVGVQLRIEGQDDTLQSGFIPLTDCSTGSDAVKILSLSQFKIFSEALFKICYSFEDDEFAWQYRFNFDVVKVQCYKSKITELLGFLKFHEHALDVRVDQGGEISLNKINHWFYNPYIVFMSPFLLNLTKLMITSKLGMYTIPLKVGFNILNHEGFSLSELNSIPSLKQVVDQAFLLGFFHKISSTEALVAIGNMLDSDIVQVGQLLIIIVLPILQGMVYCNYRNIR